MLRIEFLKWDAGDNLHCLIEGEKYVFATQEFYGGAAIYGICFPGDNSFTFLSRSKKANKFFLKIIDSINSLIKQNPNENSN